MSQPIHRLIERLHDDCQGSLGCQQLRRDLIEAIGDLVGRLIAVERLARHCEQPFIADEIKIAVGFLRTPGDIDAVRPEGPGDRTGADAAADSGDGDQRASGAEVDGAAVSGGLVEAVARATNDPGSVVGPRWLAETLSRWQARAAITVISSCPDEATIRQAVREACAREHEKEFPYGHKGAACFRSGEWDHLPDMQLGMIGARAAVAALRGELK